MRKIYSLVLMTIMLLLGTTAWAVNVASWAELTAAAATPNAEITLTKSITMPTTGVDFDFNGAVIDCRYETTSVVTGEDSVGYNYLYASKAKTYTLQNVTLKNYQGSYGAIYSYTASAVINLGSTVNIIDSKYGVYARKAATITNAGNIAGVYMKAGGSLTNSGTITSATAAGIAAAGTTTIENQAGAEITGATYGISIANGTVTNNGTITAGTQGIYVSGQTEFVNNGSINATSVSFYAAAAAQMTITNNANIDWSVYPYRANANAQSITNNAGNLTFYGYGSKSSYNFQGSVTIANAASANVILANTKFVGPLELTNVTIENGTFNGQLSGSNITIHGGTFAVAPAAGIDGYIEPQNALPKFVEGVGDLTIASGYEYRSVDGYVAPIAPRVEVTHANGSTVTCLIEEEFANAADGDEITLLEDVTSYSTLWLGTAEANGAFRSITLDLNGHTLSSATNVQNTILLTRGALYIKNSVPGQGGIAHLRDNAPDASSEIIFVCGSPTRMMKGSAYVNPRNAAVTDLFAYLLIDEGVTLSANGYGVNGISVFENASGNHPAQLNYRDAMYVNANSKWGLAGGVRIDVKGTINATKYAGKVNGLVRHPNEVITKYPGVTDVQVADTANGTFFHIFPTAVMHTSDAIEATAVYCSGYARWLIEGLCQGATGVYVKSGVVDLTDATVESTYTGTASITTGGGSGVAAGGNAVVIESNDHYTGEQALVIGGDTKISTEAEGGAAVVDVVDDTHESKVESIVINGGSFTGDNAIVISSETASEQNTTVNGVTVVGDISVGGSTDPEDVADIMGSNTHTTEVENPDGSKTVIISAGEAPTAATEWVNVAALPTGSDANWTGLTAGVIGDGTTPTTIKLGELQIISGSLTNGVQQLTVKDKAVLNVDRLIMNDYARIIVEAGGKLIVEGTQGINAPNVENITLRTSEDKQAIFLFHPNVTSNRHPNATVEFKTKSYVANSSNFVWERFGVPSYNRLEEMTYKTPQTFNSYVYIYDTSLDDWRQLGKIAKSGDASTLTTDELDKPFSAYNLICYNTVGGTEFVMKGALVGNVNADLPITETAKWATYSNSYSANVDIQTLISGLSAEMSATVWMYKVTGPNTYTWETVDDLEDHGFTVIPPMGAFILNKVQDGATSNAINYTDAVYNTSLSAAPVRRMNIADLTKAVITVTDENAAYDHVVVAASSMFTDEMDRGYDAEKYMNEAINLYVSNDNMSLAHFATDNLENTYLGFSCENGGTYTISFDKIQGEGLALIDLETNAYTLINAESMYQFSVGDNYANDYRFKIVSRQEMPTDVETIEKATINNNGIYTITGQYVGEMNIWNTLPKGIYIVNGEKLIK